MFSEQLEHFFGFFGVDLEEENSNIFESLFLSTSNFANFRILRNSYDTKCIQDRVKKKVLPEKIDSNKPNF